MPRSPSYTVDAQQNVYEEPRFWPLLLVLHMFSCMHEEIFLSSSRILMSPGPESYQILCKFLLFTFICSWIRFVSGMSTAFIQLVDSALGWSLLGPDGPGRKAAASWPFCLLLFYQSTLRCKFWFSEVEVSNIMHAAKAWRCLVVVSLQSLRLAFDLLWPTVPLACWQLLNCDS